MTQEVRITHITKRDRTNPHEEILQVGGDNTVQKWKLPQEDAIDYIRSNTYNFFVIDKNGNKVRVILAINSGNTYIKTENDGINENNLLSLPEIYW